MLGLLDPADPAAVFARYLPELKTEYAYWMEGANALAAGQAHAHAVALDDGSILNRYWDASDKPRDEAFSEDVELAAATSRPPAEIYRDIRAGAESGWDFSGPEPLPLDLRLAAMSADFSAFRAVEPRAIDLMLFPRTVQPRAGMTRTPWPSTRRRWRAATCSRRCWWSSRRATGC